MLLRDDIDLESLYTAESVLKRECCIGLQYERLDATDGADQQELSRSGTLNSNILSNTSVLFHLLPRSHVVPCQAFCPSNCHTWCFSGAAGSGHSVCSEDSWTTDDEASAAVSGNQMWSMSFEWQDGQAEDAAEATAQFEETTDFSEHSLDPASEQSSSAESSSACLNGDAAEPSPADADWVQPWNQTDIAMTASSGHTHDDSASAHPSSTKQKPKSQPMSEEHKTAILGEDISSHASMLMTHACAAVCSSSSCGISVAVPRCTKRHDQYTC